METLGNIVATYNVNGVVCHISDSAYAGKTSEELKAARNEIDRVASGIYWKWYRRHLEASN